MSRPFPRLPDENSIGRFINDTLESGAQDHPAEFDNPEPGVLVLPEHTNDRLLNIGLEVVLRTGEASPQHCEHLIRIHERINAPGLHLNPQGVNLGGVMYAHRMVPNVRFCWTCWTVMLPALGFDFTKSAPRPCDRCVVETLPREPRSVAVWVAGLLRVSFQLCHSCVIDLGGGHHE